MIRAALLLAVLGFIPMNPGVAAPLKVCVMPGKPDMPEFCVGDSRQAGSDPASSLLKPFRHLDGAGSLTPDGTDEHGWASIYPFQSVTSVVDPIVAVLVFQQTANASGIPSTAPSAGADAANPAKAGEVRKIDSDHHTVGGVALRKSTREISFDARINQSGGLIEYLLVTEKGKVHESLFSCAISPTDLNIAFKLLSYPSSPELFQIVAADQRPTGRYPDVPEEIRDGARIEISAAWRQEGAEKSCKVNELVKNTTSGEAMPPGPWLYTGSLIHQGVFRAEATGDIIAVFSNPAAMINFPGDARTNDEVWTVNPGSVPAKGTPVRITIKLFPKPAAPNTNLKSP